MIVSFRRKRVIGSKDQEALIAARCVGVALGFAVGLRGVEQIDGAGLTGVGPALGPAAAG